MRMVIILFLSLGWWIPFGWAGTVLPGPDGGIQGEGETWCCRGVAPDEAFFGNRVCGSFQTVQSGRPSFRFGCGGMQPGTDAWAEAWRDMQHYGQCGTAIENFKKARPDSVCVASEIKDIYANPGDGFILTFDECDIDLKGKYKGNLPGDIVIIRNGAQPIGRTPCPTGFDDLGNPTWGLGTTSEILRPRSPCTVGMPRIPRLGTCASVAGTTASCGARMMIDGADEAALVCGTLSAMGGGSVVGGINMLPACGVAGVGAAAGLCVATGVAFYYVGNGMWWAIETCFDPFGLQNTNRRLPGPSTDLPDPLPPPGGRIQF